MAKQSSSIDSERRAMDNIPEFSERADADMLRRILQRVADFNFILTLDATPNRQAREAYTRLMVDVRLALR